MTRRINVGYTDYPSGTLIRKVTLLGYDNNKYVEVQFEDGTTDSIKRGYIRRDVEMQRYIPDVQWHLLGGGSLRSYHRRQRRTTYDVYFDNVPGKRLQSFGSKMAALAVARRLAQATNEVVEFSGRVSNQRGSHCHAVINCMPDGDVLAFTMKNQRREGKYLRGFGKHRSKFRR